MQPPMQHLMQRRSALAALAAFSTVAMGSLTGCSSLSKAGPGVDTLDENAPRLTGRFSLQLPPGSAGHNRSTTANFELLGTAGRGRLELSTPLGSLVARVHWQPGLAWLQTPDGDRTYEDVDGLTQELLGEPLPVQALFDWLQGRPWPQARQQAVPDGFQGFQQLGWQVDLRRFADGLLVAQRLDPRNAATPLATLRLKLDAAPG